MTPSDVGLPDDAPWYGAREVAEHGSYWWIEEDIEGVLNKFLSIGVVNVAQEFEVAAFCTLRPAQGGGLEVLDNDIIAGPVKVVAKVTVEKA